MVEKLFKKLSAHRSNVEIYLNTNVTRIERINDKNNGKYNYRVHFNNTYTQFDKVIIAFPLEALKQPDNMFTNFT